MIIIKLGFSVIIKRQMISMIVLKQPNFINYQ